MGKEAYIKFSNNSGTTNYIVDVGEGWLYRQLIQAIADNFDKKDLEENCEEIIQQILYELSVDNVNYILIPDS